MKRITLLVAAVALALPAAAGAHHGHGNGHGHGDRDHAKNAAFSCKEQRHALGDDAFARLYGTNHNGRNAFGKCVSGARVHVGRVATLPRAELFEVANGTLTNAGVPNCQHTAAGCTVQASGTASGLPIQNATFASTLTIDWANARPNGAGGFCAKATGETTLVDASNGANTLVTTLSGTLCEVGATGTNVEHLFVGRYAIDGDRSTGTYAHASGTGLAVFDQKPDASVRAVELGGIRTA